MKKKSKVVICFILLGIAVYCCKKNNNSIESTSKKSENRKYDELVDKEVLKLSQERKQKRLEWINELKHNSIYLEIVQNKSTSQDYLPVLNAVSDAIKNSYNINNSSEFAISGDIADNLEKSEKGKEKMNFVIVTSSLSLPMNGGLPKEIVETFERYRDKYNFYGLANTIIYDADGKAIKIKNNYNLSYAFGLFDPKNKKVLNAIYESTQKGISNWNKDDGTIYLNQFMAIKSNYMQYLKEVYPNSPYFIDIDFEISASDLVKEYEANEVYADEKYKNKKIALSGTIANIGKDMMSNPYISFREEFLRGVICYFSNENIEIISQLNKGDHVIVIGECKGLTLTNVIIKNCAIN